MTLLVSLVLLWSEDDPLFYSSRVESLLRCVIMGMINNSTARIKKLRDRGLETKMEKSPRDKMRDWRRASSSIGPTWLVDGNDRVF